MTRLDTHRVITVPDEWYAEHLQVDRWPGSGPARHVVIGDALGDASDEARAATPSGPSLLRVSGAAGISIAVFALVYFGGQLIRAVLS